MKSLLNVFLLMLLISAQARAFEQGCSLRPNQLNEFGNNLVTSFHSQKKPLPEVLLLETSFEGEFSSKDGLRATADFEGFFRPSEDEFLSLTPLPIFGLDLSRERIVVYICAHLDPNPKNTHLTLYFLRGYHLSSVNFANFWGDLFHKPSLKVAAIPASLFGTSVIKRYFLKIFKYIPFASSLFDTAGSVQRFFANLFGDLTGLGVERVEMTPEIVTVASGVNLDSPRKVKIQKSFKIEDGSPLPGISDLNELIDDLGLDQGN